MPLSNGRRPWRPTRCWSSGCAECVPAGRRRAPRAGWGSRSPDLPGPRSRLDTVVPMNQRESSGLPLRAMVMVLLFLGIVFLLVGFQAMGSGNDEDGGSTAVTTVTATSTPTASATGEPAAAKADVRVYNISE